MVDTTCLLITGCVKKHTSRSYGAQQKYNHMHSLYPQGHFCLGNTNDHKKQNLLNTLRGVYNFLLKSGARGVDLQWKDQNDFIENMPFGWILNSALCRTCRYGEHA